MISKTPEFQNKYNVYTPLLHGFSCQAYKADLAVIEPSGVLALYGLEKGANEVVERTLVHAFSPNLWSRFEKA